jgi:uncharacterized protein
MSANLFINLAVKDLRRSIDFFTALGYDFNEEFGDENTACMVLTDDSWVLLLQRAQFSKLLGRDPTGPEAIFSLAAGSRAGVDELAERAKAAGGTEIGEPEDLGFLYGRSFTDPDGHIWNPFHLAEAPVPA